MRTIFCLTAAMALTACQSSGDSQARWNDMWVDIAHRHKYEKYSCAHHALEGYSKDPVCRPARRVSVAQKPVEPVIRSDRVQTTQQSEQVRELEGKIAVLEEVEEKNAETTNRNQKLLVDQIVALKVQLAAQQQQNKPGPAVPPIASGIHIPQ